MKTTVNEKKIYSENSIYIQGAKTHNLKNVSVNIPRNKLTVVTVVRWIFDIGERYAKANSFSVSRMLVEPGRDGPGSYTNHTCGRNTCRDAGLCQDCYLGGHH